MDSAKYRHAGRVLKTKGKVADRYTAFNSVYLLPDAVYFLQAGFLCEALRKRASEKLSYSW